MVEGPISLRKSAAPFEAIAELADKTKQIMDGAIPSLLPYRDQGSGGYFHLLDGATPGRKNESGDYSKASTATVVSFLVRSGRWDEMARAARPSKPAEGADGQGQNAGQPAKADEGKWAIDEANILLGKIVLDQPWKSAGLPNDNPFTVGFLLELVWALHSIKCKLSDPQIEICKKKLKILAASLRKGENTGRVGIKDWPTNAYLTHLVSRVLESWGQSESPTGGPSLLDDDLARRIYDKSIESVSRESALCASGPPGSADVIEMGYSVILANHYGKGRITPADRKLLGHALDLLFGTQAPDGSWPLGKPLFLYPKIGNAYCFEFEFLFQLMKEFSATRVLLAYFDNLTRSVDRLVTQAVGLPSGDGYGWASGHHPQITFPESWSTASGFDACYQIDRLIPAAVTDSILIRLGKAPVVRPTADRQLFDELLDSRVKKEREEKDLKTIIEDRMIKPVLAQDQRLRNGLPLPKNIALSAILFGPPGTSKTTYAKAISRALGWDLISIDPSHLLRNGFDGIGMELSEIVRMLRYAERVVVLFDEIDELVRERTGRGEQAESRLLTTAMLPVIADLRNSRKIVFIVATNHIETFDTAIRRPGRFDLVLPINPPSYELKLGQWSVLAPLTSNEDKKRIGDLTYQECEQLAIDMADKTEEEKRNLLEHHWHGCTLESPADPEGKKWREVMSSEQAASAVRW
jgi:DNA polymerase III delta prime subunit